jgi:hypothetical protein
MTDKLEMLRRDQLTDPGTKTELGASLTSLRDLTQLRIDQTEERLKRGKFYLQSIVFTVEDLYRSSIAGVRFDAR